MKQYISIDSNSKSTDTELHLENKKNEICGTLKTVDKEGEEPKDIKELFIQKSKLENIEKVDVEREEYSLESVAQTLNSLISALKGGASLAFAICMLGCSSLAADPPGKQKLGDISAKTYVVTNEVDPIFSSWIQGTELALTNYTMITTSSSNKNIDTNGGKGNVVFGYLNTFTECSQQPIETGDPIEDAKYAITVNYPSYSVIFGSGNINGQHGSFVQGYWNANLPGMFHIDVPFLTSKEDFVSKIPRGIGDEYKNFISDKWDYLFETKKYLNVTDTFFVFDHYEMKRIFCSPDYSTMTLKCYDEMGNEFFPMNYHVSPGRCDSINLIDIGGGKYRVISKKDGEFMIGNDSKPLTNNFSNAIWNMVIDRNNKTVSYMDYWRKYNSNYSHVQGEGNYNYGRMNHLEGHGNVAGRHTDNCHLEGIHNMVVSSESDQNVWCAHVDGRNAIGRHSVSYTWSGDFNHRHDLKSTTYQPEDKYSSHGIGTFNINPRNGLDGFYIGETNLATTLSQYAKLSDLQNGIDIDELTVDNLYLNGKSLTIINDVLHVDGKPISFEEDRFEAYHAIVTNQARIAQEAINNASNLQGIKDALNTFFNEINK